MIYTHKYYGKMLRKWKMKKIMDKAMIKIRQRQCMLKDIAKCQSLIAMNMNLRL